jgi:pyruvate dehydrogenase E2 component (dihydrolipoamide acetyltransferase)
LIKTVFVIVLKKTELFFNRGQGHVENGALLGTKKSVVFLRVAAQGGSPTRPQDAAQASPVATEAAPAATDTDTPPLPAASDTDATRIKASPLAKRIAAQKGIPLHTLHGTGPHGRILKADVLEAQATPQKPVSSTSVARAQPSPMPTGGTTAIPHTTMRKVIARRLSESKQTVPHFYLSVHCAMDALLALRTELNTLSPDDPKAPSYYRLSVNDMLIRASALALRHVPEANASWTDEAIVQYHDVDIAVAVAIPGGLITPIIRHADTKSLPTLSREMKALAERARQNKLLPEEFQGGSFSLSNLGMHGIAQFQAIVNPPQSCILAIGATEGCVVPDTNNQPRCIQRMTATLSCDHRVVDGAVGAAFLQAFRQSVEQPLRLCL